MKINFAMENYKKFRLELSTFSKFELDSVETLILYGIGLSLKSVMVRRGDHKHVFNV